MSYGECEPFEEAYLALKHAMRYLEDDSYLNKVDEDSYEVEFHKKLLNLCEVVSRNYVV